MKYIKFQSNIVHEYLRFFISGELDQDIHKQPDQQVLTVKLKLTLSSEELFEFDISVLGLTVKITPNRHIQWSPSVTDVTTARSLL